MKGKTYEFPNPLVLRDLLERLEPFAFRGDGRASLAGVLLRPARHEPGSRVVASATDGHRLALAVEEAPGLAEALPGDGLIVPTRAIREVAKILHRRNAPRLSWEIVARFGFGFIVHVEGRPGLVVEGLPGGDYPEYAKVIPKDRRCGWSFEGTQGDVARAARELGELGPLSIAGMPDETGPFALFTAEKEILGGKIEGSALIEGLKNVSHSARSSYAARVWVNGRYFAEALEFVRAPEIYLGAKDTDPILIRSSKESGLRDVCVVMPCRL